MLPSATNSVEILCTANAVIAALVLVTAVAKCTIAKR